MIRNYILIVVLTLLMAGAVIFGISESGSPFETRNRAFDQQRVADISNLTYTIENYYSKNAKLPDTLKEAKDALNVNRETVDPQSKKEYEYKKVSTTGYNLCADFATDTTKEDRINYSPYNDKFKHPKGNYCFDLSVSQNTVKPAQPINSNSNNDLDLASRGRDAARLADLANMQYVINVAVQEATVSGASLYCVPTAKYPCSGKSIVDSTANDGTGWIKFNLSYQKSVLVPILPIDPINDGIRHYTYCANNGGWEINTVLESSQQVSKMATDGGDDLNKYEVGSNLKLIDKIPECRY